MWKADLHPENKNLASLRTEREYHLSDLLNDVNAVLDAGFEMGHAGMLPL
jgi:hypothetical protein